MDVSPEGQAVHVVAPAADIFPAGQSEHLFAPAAAYFPAGHTVQSCPATEVWPASHATQLDALVDPIPAACLPAGQGVHLFAPAAAYVFFGHFVQAFPARDVSPAAQGVQAAP